MIAGRPPDQRPHGFHRRLDEQWRASHPDRRLERHRCAPGQERSGASARSNAGNASSACRSVSWIPAPPRSSTHSATNSTRGWCGIRACRRRNLRTSGLLRRTRRRVNCHPSRATNLPSPRGPRLPGRPDAGGRWPGRRPWWLWRHWDGGPFSPGCSTAGRRRLASATRPRTPRLRGPRPPPGNHKPRRCRAARSPPNQQTAQYFGQDSSTRRSWTSSRRPPVR